MIQYIIYDYLPDNIDNYNSTQLLTRGIYVEFRI